MQPSTARDSGQVDPRRSTTDIPSPQSAALGLHPVARRLLLATISRSRVNCLNVCCTCYWICMKSRLHRQNKLVIEN